MVERAVHVGMVHWVHRVTVGFDSTHKCSTTHRCIRFLCSGLLNLEKDAVFVPDDVDCMSCLVTWAREGDPYARP